MTENNSFIYLVEITAYDPSLPGTRVLRYSSGEGKTTEPTETPPNEYYENRIENPINFTRTAFSDSRVMGGMQVGYGEIVLNNRDQGLSFLLDYGLDGREVVIRTGPQNGAYPADYPVFFTGTMRAPTITTSQVQINLKDKLALFELPIQTNKYLGTNSSGNGVEGTADDIKDKPVPQTWGRCIHISPVHVNTSKYIFQVHDGAIDAIEAVYDSGIPLSLGTNRANVAAIEASAPVAGFYDTCTSEGLFRLNAPPAGKITATVRGDKTGGVYVSTVAGIVSRILTLKAGIASADISSTSVSTLNAAAGYNVGVFVDSESNIQNVIDGLLSSVGAWLAPDKMGVWTFGQLKAPSGTPVLTLTDSEITAIELQSSGDENKSVPIYSCIFRYWKHWTSFSDTEIAGSVSPSLRNSYIQEYREEKQTDSSIQTKHLLASELIRDSLILSQADAVTECGRILALHKVRRDLVEVQIRLDTENALLDIGSVIELQTDRLGYSAGKIFYVIGITSDGARGKMTLQLWG